MSLADVTPFAKIAVALFVLVNRLEGVPVFMARSAPLDDGARARIARTAAIPVTVIMLVALFVGRLLLAGLGIRIGDFMVAGGTLIFPIGVQMVFGSQAGGAGGNADDGEFAIVPLAIPLLAGPGVISGVIVYATKGPYGTGCTPTDDLLLSGIIVAVGLATWLALRAADPLRRDLRRLRLPARPRSAALERLSAARLRLAVAAPGRGVGDGAGARCATRVPAARSNSPSASLDLGLTRHRPGRRVRPTR